MTVTTEVSRATFPWTGVETSFSCGFPADDVSHLRVFFRTDAGVTTAMTLGVNYNATLASGSKLATVTPITFPASSGTVIIRRLTPAQVAEVLADGQEYSLAVIQQLHDRAAMRSAEDRSTLSRAIVLAEGVELGDGTFDLGGSGIDNLAPGTTPTSAATVAQIQEILAASGNVPAPVLAEVNRLLVATGVGTFGWVVLALDLIPDGLFTADAAGRAKIAEKFLTLSHLDDVASGIVLGRSSPSTGPVEALSAMQVAGLIGAIRYSAAQSLSDAEKLQARANLGGDYVLSRAVAAGATMVEFNLPTGFQAFEVEVSGYYADAAASLEAQLSLDGTNYRTGATEYFAAISLTGAHNTSTGSFIQNDDGFIYLTPDIPAANPTFSGCCTLKIRQGSASLYPGISWQGGPYSNAASRFATVNGEGVLNVVGAVKKIKFYAPGRVFNGVFTLRGII